MQLLVFSGWYALQNSLRLRKTARLVFVRHAIFSSAEAALMHAENQVIHHVTHCMVPLMGLTKLRGMDASFWESGGICRGRVNDLDYQFVTELLSENPCVRLSGMIPNPPASFYRLTVRMTDGETTVWLQGVLVKPADLAIKCDGVIQYVKAGRLSWREG